MDIILGRFAETNLEAMTPADLAVFASILELPDTDLLTWVTRLESLPSIYDTPLMRRLLAFEP